MRFIVGVLACIGVGVLSVALADPPQPSAAQSPTAAATPAAPAAAATAPDAAIPPTSASLPSTATSSKAPAPAEFTQEEKQLLGEGYRAEMHNGERVFCRREKTLGSNLPGPKLCGTVTQLKNAESEARDAAKHVQTWAPQPPGGR